MTSLLSPKAVTTALSMLVAAMAITTLPTAYAAESDSPSPDAHAVTQAQEKLKTAGIYHGQIDGKDGPQTAAALRSFQKQNGLPETSQLDSATVEKLSGMPTPNSGSNSK